MALVVPSFNHSTRAAELPHPLPKRARLWGVHWHRTGWRLVGCTLEFHLQTVCLACVLNVTWSWFRDIYTCIDCMVTDTAVRTSMVRLHTCLICYLELFRCMLAVIFVKHKSMMPIPSHTVWTPPWYVTIFNLLREKAVLVFLKIWWWCINNSLSVSVYVCMCVSVCSFALCSCVKLAGSSRSLSTKSFMVLPLPPSKTNTSNKARGTPFGGWGCDRYSLVVSRDASQPVNL